MEQEKLKVSVIIPVYNTEAFVRQSIKSIQCQTLQELEIIVVNDGSTDGSRAILWELAGEDRRIRVCEQENQGPSVTRNVGLSHATGRYIYFMDSDDLLEADALELCYAKCETEELDFVFFDAESFCENGIGSSFFNYKRTGNLRQGIYTGIDMLNIQIELFQFTSSVCLNFVRRDYLCGISLGFHPGILHEDQLFTLLLYLQAQRVSFISQSFFHRRVRAGSIMTRCFAWRNMEGYLTVTQELLRFGTSQSNEVRRIIDCSLTQMLNAVVWKAHVLPLRDRIKTIIRFHKDNLTRFIKMKTLLVLLFRKYKPTNRKSFLLTSY